MDTIRPRNRWVAVFLSFMLTGLGQLYNGEIRKAIIFYIVSLLVFLPAMLLMVILNKIYISILIAILVLSLIWEFFVVFDAWRVAKRSTDYCLRPYNKWYYYLLIFIVVSGSLFLVPSDYLFPQPYKVPSSSMEPSLLVGDHFFALGNKSDLHRGDIVVFELADGDDKYYVKRIIGLPGDKVKVTKNGEVFVNGKKNDQKPSSSDVGVEFFVESNGEFEYNIAHDLLGVHWLFDGVIPEKELFVMGDHRTSSRDSRVFGTVPVALVKGVAKVIYFSFGGGFRGIRWNRIGRDLSNNPHP